MSSKTLVHPSRWSIPPLTADVGPADREKEMIVSKVVQNAIIATLHPRTLIEIVVQVLHDDGSVHSAPPPPLYNIPHICSSSIQPLQLLAAAINATCMALADAGIPLK
jgi:ribonuclease PH